MRLNLVLGAVGICLLLAGVVIAQVGACNGEHPFSCFDVQQDYPCGTLVTCVEPDNNQKCSDDTDPSRISRTLVVTAWRTCREGMSYDYWCYDENTFCGIATHYRDEGCLDPCGGGPMGQCKAGYGDYCPL
jgi:hypothetical protein